MRVKSKYSAKSTTWQEGYFGSLDHCNNPPFTEYFCWSISLEILILFTILLHSNETFNNTSKILIWLKSGKIRIDNWIKIRMFTLHGTQGWTIFCVTTPSIDIFSIPTLPFKVGDFLCISNIIEFFFVLINFLETQV